MRGGSAVDAMRWYHPGVKSSVRMSSHGVETGRSLDPHTSATTRRGTIDTIAMPSLPCGRVSPWAGVDCSWGAGWQRQERDEVGSGRQGLLLVSDPSLKNRLSGSHLLGRQIAIHPTLRPLTRQQRIMPCRDPSPLVEDDPTRVLAVLHLPAPLSSQARDGKTVRVDACRLSRTRLSSPLRVAQPPDSSAISSPILAESTRLVVLISMNRLTLYRFNMYDTCCTTVGARLHLCTGMSTAVIVKRGHHTAEP